MEINDEINIKDFIEDAIKQSSEIYINRVKNILIKLSETNVHDFRVCLRRLLAQASLINEIIQLPHYIQLKSELKSQVKLFNELRDNQVQILKTQNLVYELPALYKYYHYLIDQEKLLVEKLKVDIKNIDYNRTVQLFLNILRYLDNNLNIDQFKYIISSKMNLVIERHKLANRSDLKTIHKTRLAFKKFRYSIEFLSPIINYDSIKLSNLKAFQTRMGLIQDNVVYLNYLNDWQNNFKALNPHEFQEIEDRIINERELLLNDYFNNFDEIYNFW